MIRFALKIHRVLKRGGKGQSYLLARGANGRLRANAIVVFADGSRLAGSVVRSVGVRER